MLFFYTNHWVWFLINRVLAVMAKLNQHAQWKAKTDIKQWTYWWFKQIIYIFQVLYPCDCKQILLLWIRKFFVWDTYVHEVRLKISRNLMSVTKALQWAQNWNLQLAPEYGFCCVVHSLGCGSMREKLIQMEIDFEWITSIFCENWLNFIFGPEYICWMWFSACILLLHDWFWGS